MIDDALEAMIASEEGKTRGGIQGFVYGLCDPFHVSHWDYKETTPEGLPTWWQEESARVIRQKCDQALKNLEIATPEESYAEGIAEIHRVKREASDKAAPTLTDSECSS